MAAYQIMDRQACPCRHAIKEHFVPVPRTWLLCVQSCKYYGRCPVRCCSDSDRDAELINPRPEQDRVLLRSDLLVSSLDMFGLGQHVLRYDGNTGEYRGVFIRSLSGGQ